MKYCTYCGTELPEGAAFCPNCGARATAATHDTRTESDGPTLAESVFGRGSTAPTAEGRSRGIAVLSFFFPIVGLILWAIWRDTQPGKAMSAAKGGLASVCVGTPIIGLIVYLTMKDSSPELARTSGIAAIVGVVIGAVFTVLGLAGGILAALYGAEIEGGYYAFASMERLEIVTLPEGLETALV